MNIKPSDLDDILNSIKETYNIVNSKQLNGDSFKNLEIIRELEKNGYVVIRSRYETNNHVDFSITDKGKYFKLTGGYAALEKRKRWKKVKECILNLVKFVLGLFFPKLFFLIFRIVTL